MIDTQQLREFLVRAKKTTYAAGDQAGKKMEQDSSTSLFYNEDDLRYHDNYFGGEPYGGREVVFFRNKPIWIMTYYGCVKENISDFKSVYLFLQHCLSAISERYPYRGAKEYTEGPLHYTNTWIGEIDKFSGEEIITLDGKEIYQARYVGGLVDQRK